MQFRGRPGDLSGPAAAINGALTLSDGVFAPFDLVSFFSLSLVQLLKSTLVRTTDRDHLADEWMILATMKLNCCAFGRIPSILTA